MSATDLTPEFESRILDAADAHFDERVHLESVRKVTRTVALFISRWCGIEPRELNA